MNDIIFKKYFEIYEQIPIPIVFRDFEKNLYLNPPAHTLVEKLFDGFNNYKDQVEFYKGYYKEICEHHDLNVVYKEVFKTHKAAGNIFVPLKTAKENEQILLFNISLMTDFNEIPIGFLTVMEDITEIFNYNRELHYSLLSLKGVIEAFAHDRIAYLIAYGEEETVKHLIEVRTFSEMIADAIMRDNIIENKDVLEYSKITPLYMRMLGLAALLHDFGKVEPDIHKLISQPRSLTEDEYEQVKHHAHLGAKLIGYENEMLRMCWLVALYHHEKYDGSGYPSGLKGRDIPLSARIVAFADMYSAIKSKRPYKDSIDDLNEIISQIEQCKNSFDPIVYRIGMSLIPDMYEKSGFIEEEYKNFELNAEEALKLITDVFNVIMKKSD